MASKLLRTANRTLNVLQNGSKFASVSVRKNSLWTKEGIIKSPYASVDIPNYTLYDYVWLNLEKWPERTLTVCARTGRGYTYEQAFNLSNAFAANLRQKFKIRDGDVITVMLPNVPDFPLIMLGVMAAGGVVTTINPIYTAHEIQRQLLMSDSKMIVTLPDKVNVVREAIKLAKVNIPIIVVKTNGDPIPEGTVAFNELSEDIHVDKSCLKKVRRTANDLCFLPYSSGTTGLPKGVELTHRNIIANCQQISDPAITCNEETTATHQDVAMAILPFFHIYGSVVVGFHEMAQGVKLVTLDKFQPEVYLQAIEKFKVNVLFLAPPLIILMTQHPMASAKVYQYLEHVINGAAPIVATDAERFLSKVQRKIRFGQGYGLTETAPVVAMSPTTLYDYNAVGHPVPNTDIRIVDSDLKNLGPNETGELLVRGPQVMRGYRNNSEANANVLTNDGWFRTGDLATVDDDGIIKICDRLKELIKVKGFQVPPAELEAVLRDHPAVSDAAVIGVPHATKGETPKAFVALKPGFSASPKDLCSFVAERVAAYKRIDDISVLDSIPRSAAGKILRKDLKSKYC
ncbi:4-coumarate--CoA ligase 3-like isoform X1 [Vanessa atalanta]|uniref:4-coumarate--CoA ligase 3-like isoform X1 n=1 Tax=Vanessa atalanta TaxID=42275 RepID=UPI001FCD4752|nr:4-coumarate--CoA ligase 3-like isoform X1 [Vanessa atalanta]XP_047534123.1 4-coumarate--CoA ligase 3-like isoform X1 [Vanessa atalanta]